MILIINEPDISYVKSAAEIGGKYLKKDATVVPESTVYSGITEEVAVSILERESGLRCGSGFNIGYSPERIKTGDEAHTLDKIMKIVAGMDAYDKHPWRQEWLGFFSASTDRVHLCTKNRLKSANQFTG